MWALNVSILLIFLGFIFFFNEKLHTLLVLHGFYYCIRMQHKYPIAV